MVRAIPPIMFVLALSGCADLWHEIEAGEAYQGEGVSFRYPYSWSVAVAEEQPILGSAWKVVRANHGDAHVIIDVITPKVSTVPAPEERAKLFTARALEDLQTFRWADVSFGEQSSTPVERTFAGAARSGERWQITVEVDWDSDPVITTDLYAFETGTRSVAVAAGGRPDAVEEHKDGIEQILGSLAVD